ncbi:hypothetical protein ACTWQB_09460 [Piscibacillus sp. B03]
MKHINQYFFGTEEFHLEFLWFYGFYIVIPLVVIVTLILSI